MAPAGASPTPTIMGHSSASGMASYVEAESAQGTIPTTPAFRHSPIRLSCNGYCHAFTFVFSNNQCAPIGREEGRSFAYTRRPDEALYTLRRIGHLRHGFQYCYCMRFKAPII